ncbi:unnamed protein product [Thlaspi arvense]|uniref:Scarecrow-like protein 9 n=1 Tax=Thlaspi arvense TaxID=13288 RepID=A0AAU9RLI4_THLAR|nr:unnamed protein product [Thlaspi arvense]
MVMDPRLRGYLTSMDGVQFRDQSESFFPDQNLIGGPRFENTSLNLNFGGIQFPPNDPSSANAVPTLNLSAEEDPQEEDCDFSDAVLKYISQILMEEDMEDKTCMLHESLDLQAAEKSFYEVLGKKYPPSPETCAGQSGESAGCYLSGSYGNYINSSSNGSDCIIGPSWTSSLVNRGASSVQSLPVYNKSLSSVSSSNSPNNIIDGFVDSPISPLQVSDFYGGNQSIWQFRKGAEEARKFLPSNNELLINFEGNTVSPWEPKEETSKFNVKAEKIEEGEPSTTGLRGKKNPHREEIDLEEERSSKQAAVFPESVVRSEMFDTHGKGATALKAYREVLRNKANNKMLQNEQSKGPKNGRVVVRKQMARGNVLLMVLRHGWLEQAARSTKPLSAKETSAADYLKAYYLYLASCPFRKISNFIANKTIMDKAKNSMRLHVIDFGILYGFQWPTLIQRIAPREGGPPKIRITGIEFPQPGFRPAAGIEETGRRLADYAQSFGVPFEYNCIAKKWDCIKLEDLHIEKDEFLVVNCLYRSQTLHDETVLANSSRDTVLNLIRKINPDLFIHGILNGAYNAPFFVTRFREALFHFSALFDILETNVPREHHERMLIEREIFGKEAMNVIACEGWERVERPETYKQWRVRNLRAGFTQIPFDREIVKKAIDKVRSSYHKDFLIDEDSQWLLQGWKGRTIHAISCWKPL